MSSRKGPGQSFRKGLSLQGSRTMVRLAAGVFSLASITLSGCSQDDRLDRLRLAILLSQYRLDVKEAKTFEDVDPIYRRGQQLAIELKRYLPPAALPLYQARIDTSLLYRDGVLAGLERRTRLADEAAETLAKKERAYNRAHDEYIAVHKATYGAVGDEKFAELGRAKRARKTAEEEYVRAEREHIKAQKQVRDVEESYMFGLVHAWDWLDLYMQQLVQYEGDVM